jgi:hypothetical protein
MHNALLRDCWPFFAAIGACATILWCLCRFSWCMRPAYALVTREPRVLRKLHSDECGAVQSLSFVLTLPIFVMLMLFIVQLSQLTIARIMVEYAAYAAARSAIVWIPADLGDGLETANRVGAPYLSLGTVHDEAGNEFERLLLTHPSRKLHKIELAAAHALMSVCPSRDVGAKPLHPGMDSFASIERAYQVMDQTAGTNTRIPDRLKNKLSYALAATTVRIEVRHKDSEPPLIWHDLRPYPEEFETNEIGWQDQVLVTVQHDFALLPGPARLLAKRVVAPGKSMDEVADRIRQVGNVFVYSLSATVRLSNEGEKPVLSYVHSVSE